MAVWSIVAVGEGVGVLLGVGVTLGVNVTVAVGVAVGVSVAWAYTTVTVGTNTATRMSINTGRERVVFFIIKILIIAPRCAQHLGFALGG